MTQRGRLIPTQLQRRQYRALQVGNKVKMGVSWCVDVLFWRKWNGIKLAHNNQSRKYEKIIYVFSKMTTKELKFQTNLREQIDLRLCTRACCKNVILSRLRCMNCRCKPVNIWMPLKPFLILLSFKTASQNFILTMTYRMKPVSAVIPNFFCFLSRRTIWKNNWREDGKGQRKT